MQGEGIVVIAAVLLFILIVAGMLAMFGCTDLVFRKKVGDGQIKVACVEGQQ